MDTFKDRRQYPRSFEPVTYRQVGNESMEGSGTGLDISAGGMRIRVTQPIERSARIDLELLLPSGWLAVSARVAWSIAVEGAGYEVGLRFTEMSMTDRSLLQAAISPPRY
ncbi:MAG: hypothetical protein NVS9B1_26900 [Candidatus Dormibacteraceae bacterium]